MKALRPLLALGAAIAAMVAVPAFADTPTSLTIVGHQVLPSPGTFTLSTGSGSISDYGSFDESFRHFAALPSPVTGIAQLELVFTGQAGVLTMQCEDRFGAPTGSLSVINGNCVITAGTGTYAGLQGTAHLVALFDATGTVVDVTLQGQVH